MARGLRGQAAAPQALREAGLGSVCHRGTLPGVSQIPELAAGLGRVPLCRQGVVEMRTDPDEERWIYRIGGVAAIVGSVLGGVGNLLHPVTPEHDPVGVAQVIAGSGIWTPIHLVIILGILLMLGGLIAICQSIRGGLAGALARFGLFAAVAGATIGLVLVILDGVAARQLAQEWASAAPGDKATALGLVHLNETLNFALASLFNFVFAAATFILFGLAVALSRVYPRWLGWVVFVGGVASIGAGLIQALVGEPTTASRILTIFGPTVITLWLFIMGILLLRKERAVMVARVAAADGGAP